MKIELKLWDDQSGYDVKDINTGCWEVWVNDVHLDGELSFVTIQEAHIVVGRILDIEDEIYILRNKA